EEAEESKKEAKEEPEDTKKMDYGDKYVQPSDKEPEEYKGVPIHAEGLNFGKAQLFKPTKEELVAAKSVAFNKNAAFGIKGKSGKSATAVAFDKWAAAELERYTLNKQ